MKIAAPVKKKSRTKDLRSSVQSGRASSQARLLSKLKKKARQDKQYKEEQRRLSALALEQDRYSREQAAAISKAAYAERKLWRKLGALVPPTTPKKNRTQFAWKVLVAEELNKLGAEFTFSGKAKKVFTDKTSPVLQDLSSTLEFEIVLEEVEVFKPIVKELNHVSKKKVSVEDAYTKLAAIWS